MALEIEQKINKKADDININIKIAKRKKSYCDSAYSLTLLNTLHILRLNYIQVGLRVRIY